MNKIPTFEEFLIESSSTLLDKNGKKPEFVFNVSELSYDTLIDIANPHNGDLNLPSNSLTGTTEFVFYKSKLEKSKLEIKYRENFDKWKNETLEKWGNSIQIYSWNEVRKTPIFLFVSGSSKKLEDHIEKIKNIKPNHSAISQYYSNGVGKKYFGD